MKLLKTIIPILLLLLVATTAASAANVTISGVVIDNAGVPIPGAALVGPGNVHAITDIDGKFSLTVPDGSEVKVSCLGFLTYSFKARKGDKLTITLMEHHHRK